MTRREWQPEHAARFYAGRIVDAWDRSPRIGKGAARKVASIRIARPPYRSWSTDVLSEWECEREGFNWLRANGDWQRVDEVLAYWSSIRRLLYVVEFELLEVVL